MASRRVTQPVPFALVQDPTDLPLVQLNGVQLSPKLTLAYHAASLAKALIDQPPEAVDPPRSYKGPIPGHTYDSEITAPGPHRPAGYNITSQTRAERALHHAEMALEAERRPFPPLEGNLGSRMKVRARVLSLLERIKFLASAAETDAPAAAKVFVPDLDPVGEPPPSSVAPAGAVAADEVVTPAVPERSEQAIEHETELAPADAVVAAPVDATGDAHDDLRPAPNDPDERRSQERKVRRGQPMFRANLMNLYGGACCISGWGPENVLEAAHIDEHAATGDNSSGNGLLLRSDLHCLFDDGLLHVDPDTLTVVLDPALHDTPYREFQGKKLCERRDGSTPDLDRLRLRWETRNR